MYWYALMLEGEDNDWGSGFDNYQDAERRLLEDDYYSYIAVISGDVCLETITREDIEDGRF